MHLLVLIKQKINKFTQFLPRKKPSNTSGAGVELHVTRAKPNLIPLILPVLINSKIQLFHMREQTDV